MSKYVLDPETLTYRSRPVPKYLKHLRYALMVVLGAALVGLYYWIYVSVLGFELPKTTKLKREYAKWEAKVNLVNLELDACESVLLGIEQRDDDVYRSIYGLSPIPDELKFAGIEGINRYEELDALGANSKLKNLVLRTDILAKRIYVDSKALDEVAVVARESGDMISCVPNVPPILPKEGTYRISSRFGYRTDPIYGDSRRHTGQDFATKTGNPVYATGDAVVEYVGYQFRGYGNEIILDHGYGYKTRYAHLNTIEVVEGMTVRRGERIGTVGNTGKSTGPHLHYEVIYRGAPVNPMNYLDINMPVDEYIAMIERRSEESPRDKRSSTMELLRRGRANNGR